MSKEQTVQDAQIVLNKALHNLKSELTAVKKDSKNPFFKSNYADLNAHLELLEPLLNKHNLVLTQSTKTNGQFNIVESAITEVSANAMVVSSLKIPDLDDMQKLGGAITYARRYTLSALLGMRAEDDDGNLASGKPKKRVTKKASNDDF